MSVIIIWTFVLSAVTCQFVMIAVKLTHSLLCRIFWESKNFEGHTDKVEPWYGTAYSIEKITASAIEVCDFMNSYA